MFGTLETLEDRRLMSGSIYTTGSALSESAIDLVVDAKGNRYVAGTFAGSSDFQPGRGKHVVKAKGEHAGYVARYDKDGNVDWVYTWGKKNADSSAQSLAIDAKGNLIVGASIDAEGFDDDISQILKLDKKGKLAWKKTINSGGWKGVTDVAADAKGGVYATGTFSGALKLGKTTLETADSFDTNIFIVRYDKNGKQIWAKQFGGDSSRKAHALVTDSKLNVYVAGYIYGNTDFNTDPEEETILTTSGYEGFLAKLDKNGELSWAKKIAGTTGDSDVNSVNVDEGGNVYIAGSFNDSLNLDGATLTDEMSDNLYDDAFIAKLDGGSGKAQWARAMGGTNNVSAGNVVVDGNYVYFSGSFVGTADLDPDAGKDDNCACVGWSNGFVVKMKTDGKHIFSRHIAQKQQIVTSGTNSVGGLACDDDGNLVIAGTFEWETDFDPSAKKELIESVNWDPDIFVLTLDAMGRL
jgi:hypothetical protein